MGDLYGFTELVIYFLDNVHFLPFQVINIYFELLKEREKREPKKFLKCHFFNTFFYKKVCNLHVLFLLLTFTHGSRHIFIYAYSV